MSGAGVMKGRTGVKRVAALATALSVLSATAVATTHATETNRRPAARPTAVQKPDLIGVGNVPGCLFGASPNRFLRRYKAQVLRVVINPKYGATGSAAPCIEAAYKAGFRIHVVIQVWSAWSPTQDAAFFSRVLPRYAPYAWAVSVGNEQELKVNSMLHPLKRSVGLTGRQYAAVWKAVEPIVARLAPHTIRVAGEISPWGLSYLRDALAAGLPGAQAIAVHPYRVPFGVRISAALSVARRARLPLWLTEGLSRPGAFALKLTVSERMMAGAAVAGIWLQHDVK
jgi:hypothetical protein